MGAGFSTQKALNFFLFKKSWWGRKKERRNRHRLCSGNRSCNCLSEKGSQRRRVGKALKGGQRSSVCRGEESGDRRFGGGQLQKNCHWERCGSGGSLAARLGSGAHLAGGRCPVGGTGLGHRPGDSEGSAKWHRVSEPLGSRREGDGTVCALALWRLPILRPWPALLWSLPISGGPQKTGKGRKRRRRRLNERLQWEVWTGSVVGGKLLVGCPVQPRCCRAPPQQPGPHRRFPHHSPPSSRCWESRDLVGPAWPTYPEPAARPAVSGDALRAWLPRPLRLRGAAAAQRAGYGAFPLGVSVQSGPDANKDSYWEAEATEESWRPITQGPRNCYSRLPLTIIFNPREQVSIQPPRRSPRIGGLRTTPSVRRMDTEPLRGPAPAVLARAAQVITVNKGRLMPFLSPEMSFLPRYFVPWTSPLSLRAHSSQRL